MSDDDLERTDNFGYTALAETTLVGNLEMAKCMLGRKKNLFSNKSSLELLPVVLAVFHGHIPLARYLYTHTPLEDLTAENGHNGVILIIQTIFTREFGKYLWREPSLAFALDREKCSPLKALASVPCAFLSRDGLVFWKIWIFDCK
ncbi:ankyrin repeat-containing protein itn1 [Fagus crenata]